MSNISYYAVLTIVFSEVKNFLREFQYTIIAPMINTLLFVFILSTIGNYYSLEVNSNTSYLEFLIPGMVIMVVIQTSFSHISETIVSMKQIGSFNDYLIAPISRIEIYLSFLISSIIICLIVCFINILILFYFVTYESVNFYLLIYYLILTVVIFSSIGAITGLLSFTWDVQSTVSNFIIIPLSFLSGTFFSIDSLNYNWKFIFFYNPIYYLVDGLRHAFLNIIPNAATWRSKKQSNSFS